MNTSGLVARIAKLEDREARFDEGFLDVLALDSLSDNELGLVSEFVALSNSGYSLGKIQTMMGEDSYRVAVAAIQKADEERERLKTCGI